MLKVGDDRLDEIILINNQIQNKSYLTREILSALTELRERREREKQAEIDYYSNETHT